MPNGESNTDYDYFSHIQRVWFNSNRGSTHFALLSSISVISNWLEFPTQKNLENDHDILSFGYWYNKNQAAGDDFVPLYTRFQPQNCREPAEQKSDRCKEPMDIARFEPYAFQRSARSFNRSLQEILGGKQERICVEGASHSRKLCQSIAKLLDEANNEIMTSNLTYHNVTLASSSFTIQFAEDYEHKIPDFLQKNCTKIIFGVGQWDLGWPRRHPTPFRQYEERLKQSMTVMIQQLRNERNIDLYLRSTQ